MAFVKKNIELPFEANGAKAMNRIAIVVSSQSGHTEKIARSMAGALSGENLQVDVLNIDQNQLSAFRGYDAAIIGCPVYLGDFSQALIDWTWENREELNSIPSAFFTVSLNAADARPKARATDDKALRSFIHQTDFHPRFVASFAGALNYTQYSFFKRCVLQGMSAAVGGPTDISQDFDLTNWDEVSRFSQAFESQDIRSEFATINRLPVAPQPLWPAGLARVA